MVSSWLATNFLLKICFIIDQVAGSTFKIPYTVILALHHRLQSDYGFQDIGHVWPFSKAESWTAKINKNFSSGSPWIYSLIFTQGPGCGIVIINPVSLAGAWNHQLFSLPPLCLPEGIYSPFSGCAVQCQWGRWDQKTDSLCPKRIRPRRFGLPQANSSFWTCNTAFTPKS